MPKTHEQRDTSVPVGNSNDMFLRRKSLWFLKQIRTLKVEADENNFQDLDDSTLVVKLEQLDRLQTQFEETQSQLEREDITEIEGEARVIFSEAYVSIKANITKVLGSALNLMRYIIYAQVLYGGRTRCAHTIATS